MTKNFKDADAGVVILETALVLPIILLTFLFAISCVQAANTADGTRTLAASSCAAGARHLIYSDSSQRTAAENAARAAAEDAFAQNLPGTFFIASTTATLGVSFTPAGAIICTVTSVGDAIFPVPGVFGHMGMTAVVAD